MNFKESVDHIYNKTVTKQAQLPSLAKSTLMGAGLTAIPGAAIGAMAADEGHSGAGALTGGLIGGLLGAGGGLAYRQLPHVRDEAQAIMRAAERKAGQEFDIQKMQMQGGMSHSSKIKEMDYGQALKDRSTQQAGITPKESLELRHTLLRDQRNTILNDMNRLRDQLIEARSNSPQMTPYIHELERAFESQRRTLAELEAGLPL